MVPGEGGLLVDAKVTKLPVKVVPGSSRDAVAGWLGDTLKVRVAAPPERSKANAALIGVVAEALGVPRGRVELVSGHSSARKVLEIRGLSEAQVLSRLRVRVSD